MRSVRRAAAATALVCAACAGPAVETKPEPAAALSEPREAAAPEPVTVAAPPSREARAAPPAAPVSPASSRVKPAALKGLAEDALARLMGAPGFKRVDDPAVLWQYRGRGCILDVFLYADGPVYRVDHLEFREAGAGGEPLEGRAAETCFSGILPKAAKKG